MERARATNRAADFELLGLLGRGGMGTVWEARDLRRGHLVALKRLDGSKPEQIARFKREARALSGLEHPGLVRVYELIEQDDDHFLSMELVQGRPLDEYCEFGTPPRDRPPAQRGIACHEGRLRQVMAQLAEALHVLHRHGVLHRDVKPGNVLVSDAGRAVLLDLGLAAWLDADAAQVITRGIVGSVPYMSPEQAAGKRRLSAATDWYAFGVILYEALTGRLPHEGNQLAMLVGKNQVVPPPIRQLVPAAPEDLSELSAALLALDPEKRPRGGEVLERLGIEASRVHSFVPQGLSQSRLKVVATGCFGRQRELLVLNQGYERVAAGGAPHLAVVEAASGLGKSSLLNAFVDQLRHLSPQPIVLTGRCYEREHVRFKAFDPILEGLASVWQKLSMEHGQERLPEHANLLPAVFPALRRVDALAALPSPAFSDDLLIRRERAWTALREALRALAVRAPVVIVLDDMQWSDVDSLALLRHLLAHEEPCPVLVALGARLHSTEAGPLADFLARHEEPWDHLHLAPIDRKAARELALARLGPSARRLDVEALVDDSQGHPMFLAELCLQFTLGGASEWERRQSLDELIAERVAQLSVPFRELLDVLAVAGEPVDRSEALEAANLSPRDGTHALYDLTRACLVQIHHAPNGREFVDLYHDRVRETLLLHLSPQRRRHLHARLAELMEAGPLPRAEALQQHWLAAREPERARPWLARAAEGAMAGGEFDRAAELYGRLADMTSADSPQELRFIEDHALALDAAGRTKEAADLCARACEGLPVGRQFIGLHCSAAKRYLAAGHLAAGRRHAEEALRALDAPLAVAEKSVRWRILMNLARLSLRRHKARALPNALATERSEQIATRVDVLCSLSAVLTLSDPQRAMLLGLEACLAAGQCGDWHMATRGLLAGAVCCSTLGANRLAESVRVAVAEVAKRTEPGWERFYRHAGELALVFYEQNDWPTTLATSSTAVDAWLELGRGRGWEHSYCVQFRLWSSYLLGRYASTRKEARAELRVAEEQHNQLHTASLITCFARFDVLDQGVAAVRERVVEARERWLREVGDESSVQHYWALRSEMQLSAYAGTFEADWPAFEREWKRFHQSFLQRVAYLAMDSAVLLGGAAILRARGARQRGDDAGRGALLAEARKHLRALERSKLPAARLYARQLAAAVADVEGRSDHALAELRALAEEGSEAALPSRLSARFALGERLGGDEGAELLAGARLYLIQEGAREPDRFRALLDLHWLPPPNTC